MIFYANFTVLELHLNRRIQKLYLAKLFVIIFFCNENENDVLVQNVLKYDYKTRKPVNLALFKTRDPVYF